MSVELREQLGSEPLVSVDRGFAENLKAQIGAAGNRLRSVVDDDPLTAMRHRMDQFNRQQIRVYALIEQLADHVDGARTASDRQLAAVQRQLDTLSRTIQGVDQSDTDLPRTPPALPAEVARLFGEAVDVLEELTQLDAMLSDVFDPGVADATEDVRRRLRTENFLAAIGAATVMRSTVLAFQARMGEWFRAEAPDGSGGPSAAAGDRLDALCRAYDDVFEYLPLFNLDPLVQLGPPTGGLFGRLQSALENLSPRVQRAVLRALSTSGS
jgi:hypothetical protein